MTNQPVALKRLLSVVCVAALILTCLGGAVTAFAATATGVTISQSAVTVQIGGTYQLSATVTPSDASQTVSWTSANPAIATVSASGLVTGVSHGSVRLVATTADGSNKSAETIVNVSSTGYYGSSTGIDIVYPYPEVSINVGQSYSFEARVYPSGAVYEGYSWSVLDTSIASYSISSYGRSVTVTGTRPGTTTLQVYNNGYYDTLIIRVGGGAYDPSYYYNSGSSTPYGELISGYNNGYVIRSMSIVANGTTYNGAVSTSGLTGTVTFSVPASVDLSSVTYYCDVPYGALVIPSSMGRLNLNRALTFSVIAPNNSTTRYTVSAGRGAGDSENPYGELIDPDAAATDASGNVEFGNKKYVVQADNTARYSMPSTSSTRLAALKKGTVLKVVRITKGFAECLSSDGPTFFVVNSASGIKPQ